VIGMSKTFCEIGSNTWNESQANGEDSFIPVTGSNYVADLLQLDTSHKWVVGFMRIAGPEDSPDTDADQRTGPREYRQIPVSWQFRSNREPVTCSESKLRYRWRSL
jgi:hypothetical protein